MNQGTKLAVFSAIFIGINIVFANAAAKMADPILIAMYSAIIASLILSALMFVKKRKFSSFYEMGKSQDFWKIVVSRNIIGSIIFIYGISMTTAVNSLIIVRLEPILVVLFGYALLNEKIRRRDLFYVLMMILGAVFVSTGGNFAELGATNAGDALVLLSLVALGYSYIPSRRMMKKVGAIELNTFSSIVGAVALIAVSLTVSRTLTISQNALLLIFASTIFYSLLGLTLWFKALESVHAWKVAALLSIGPIAGGALAFFWLGESLNVVQAIGAVMVLVLSYKICIERKH